MLSKGKNLTGGDIDLLVATLNQAQWIISALTSSKG